MVKNGKKYVILHPNIKRSSLILQKLQIVLRILIQEKSYVSK